VQCALYSGPDGDWIDTVLLPAAAAKAAERAEALRVKQAARMERVRQKREKQAARMERARQKQAVLHGEDYALDAPEHSRAPQ
jgi:ElaB/YqjD/DUF883 family membrane-anchored ribosome-binding protein